MHYHISGISLRLRHPDKDVGALLEQWGFEVGLSWIAGTPRTTPKGTPLGGLWPHSYAYSRFPGRGTTLAHRLRLILKTVEPAAEKMAAFVESGGTAELFIGWHFERNSGDLLDWELLRGLADCRLSLALDIYPDAGLDPEEFPDG